MMKSKKINLGKKGKKNLLIIGSVLVLLVGVTILVTNVFKKDNDSKPTEAEKQQKENDSNKKTGLKIVDVNSKSRPYAVMINNISVARKVQSGLQDAYIIYELIAEGGITRYMALFKDQNTARIGSIRSSRHYYLDYALENDAIYVHHGQSPQAESDFKTLKSLDRIVVGNTTGWRENPENLASEHTLFTSIEKLQKGLKGVRTELKGGLLLSYSEEEIDMANIKNAKPALNVSITYSSSTTSEYTYNNEKGYYMRSVNGKKHVDYVTKEQYHFKNIIIYQVKNSTIVGGGKGRQELENIGKGSGYYISGGYSIPIKWEKTSREAKTKYYYEDGQELKVNDGNTFIQIQPTGQSLKIS